MRKASFEEAFQSRYGKIPIGKRPNPKAIVKINAMTN